MYLKNTTNHQINAQFFDSEVQKSNIRLDLNNAIPLSKP